MLVLVPTIHEAVRLFGPSIEGELLQRRFSYQVVAGLRLEVSLCGFGLASAGSGAAYALTRYLQRNHQILPSRVILLGIAGSYNEALAPIGSALYGTEVFCHGVGIGEGLDYEGASRLGWSQSIPAQDALPIGDEIELSLPQSAYALSRMASSIRRGAIISACAASADLDQASRRLEMYKAAVMEDMESFSVALACQLWKTPLTVIRGISNMVGVHDKSKWKVAAALEAVSDLLPTAVNQIQVENL